MTRLHKKVIAVKIEEMEQAANGGPATFDPWHDKNAYQMVRLEFPSGELLNPNLAGYLWAWTKTYAMETGLAIEKRDRFVAQGLEGKISIRTTMSTALDACRGLPVNRRQILTD